MNFLARTPVIIGIGEVIDRPERLDLAKEPRDLMVDALRQATDDAGCNILKSLQSLEVVSCTSWGYEDLPAQVAAAVGASPKIATYGEIGGDTPIRFLHETGLNVAAGELEVAAICGAEAAQTTARATKTGVSLPWTPQLVTPSKPKREGIIHPLALRFGLDRPLYVYPLYEYATSAAWGQNAAQAGYETGEIYSRFSSVAATNMYAWDRHAYSPQEVIEPTTGNRLVAGPYTRRMVANPMVNQGGAVIVASYEKAKSLGIPDERLIFLWGGAAASERPDFATRAQFERSDAMKWSLESTRDVIHRNGREIDFAELYSCFPCIPKMARRVLDWPIEQNATVTGGLSFFGGPYNNYMLHAVCAMTRELRAHSDGVGLLYGLGGFATKHHSLAIANSPPKFAIAPGGSAATRTVADESVPSFNENYVGQATLETFTIFFDRAGMAERAVVFGRTKKGERVLAQTIGADAGVLDLLVKGNVVGMEGVTKSIANGTLSWRFKSG
jgi:acetyl-CoA C-acetyltransferase